MSLSSRFEQPVVEVAKDLLGGTLTLGGCSGRISEVEAYHQSEPGCHGHTGVTPRCQDLFGPPGTIYVYRSYGIHLMLNFVCEADGVGAAVLIRALEPMSGLERMRTRRKVSNDKLLCAGPGRLAQALSVAIEDSGDRVGRRVEVGFPVQRIPNIESSTRIGLTKGTDLKMRFAARGERWLSQPMR